MAGTVITISPRVSIDALERQARRRVERDGSATFTASSIDRRQTAHLDRLYRRLATDSGLEVGGGVGHADGVIYLSVAPAGRRTTGWWGGPKTG